MKYHIDMGFFPSLSHLGPHWYDTVERLYLQKIYTVGEIR